MEGGGAPNARCASVAAMNSSRSPSSTPDVSDVCTPVRRSFTIYDKFDAVWLAPAWLEGREVIAVFKDRADPKPSYMMWLEWRDGQISFIHDYRYVRYVVADAELGLAPDAKPAGEGAAH